MPMLKTLRRAWAAPWLRYFNKSRRSRRKLAAAARALGLPAPDGNPLAARKRSDTLFILGSGASVLTYGDDEWAKIAAADSLGFNYWIVHPFVPTHYVFELTKLEWDLACISQNLAVRGDVTSQAALYMKDAERFDPATIHAAVEALPRFGGNALHLMWEAEIPGDTLPEFARAVASLERMGCFSGAGWAVPRKRATLFFAVNLAVRAGYRQIVLCGVDLNNTRYFFKSEGFAAAAGLCIPPDYQSGPVHKTNDPTHGEVTIGAILDVYDRLVLQPRGIALSVAKSSSALHPRFPAYFG
ncbi:MAG: hypothetical protein M0T84_10540 [Betaproteobacteria bacterium]|nr:hypothetical protein [Betaproteobacteria bacterium]